MPIERVDRPGESQEANGGKKKLYVKSGITASEVSKSCDLKLLCREQVLGAMGRSWREVLSISLHSLNQDWQLNCMRCKNGWHCNCGQVTGGSAISKWCPLQISSLGTFILANLRKRLF